jgi:hypothetical protein
MPHRDDSRACPRSADRLGEGLLRHAEHSSHAVSDVVTSGLTRIPDSRQTLHRVGNVPTTDNARFRFAITGCRTPHREFRPSSAILKFESYYAALSSL